MLVGAMLAFTLAAGTSALAITGRRQGCLSVVNNMYQTLIVHVRRASKDGDYRVGALTAVFLDPDALHVTGKFHPVCGWCGHPGVARSGHGLEG